VIIKNKLTMRTFLPLLHGSIGTIALLTTVPAFAQSPCDELTVFPPRYDAFDPERIEVWVNNQSTEIFSYPNFVLLNDQGQVLASEEVTFFGIGGTGSHYMQVTPGVSLPTGPFDATLQLFGNFGDTLFCTWEFPGLTLCPAEACVPAQIYLTNTGELNAFQAFWWVTNTADGSQVASGNFAMNDVDATQFDSLCLPPGDYVLEFTPFSPIDETYIMGITPNAQFTPGFDGTMQPDNTPLDLAFSWYEACTEGTNGLAEQVVDPPMMVVDQGMLRISDPKGRALGEISLWSSDGRMITTRTVNADTAEFPLNGLAPGIILVRSEAREGHIFTQRILTW
jgi:hypothetical protein